VTSKSIVTTLFGTVYATVVPIKFILFYRKYPKVCELIRNIVKKLKPRSMERAMDDERKIEKLAKIVLIALCVSELPFIYVLVLTTPPNWIDILIAVTYFPSGIAISFTNFLLQFIYFNLCVQICSLLKQIEDDLKEIHLIRDKKRLIEMLGDVVEFHLEVHQIIAELLDCFKNILSLNFVLNIWLFGHSLMFPSDSYWTVFLMSSPFVLFAAWVFCYASQIVMTRVSRML
jgi:hypothetical protein